MKNYKHSFESIPIGDNFFFKVYNKHIDFKKNQRVNHNAFMPWFSQLNKKPQDFYKK